MENGAISSAAGSEVVGENTTTETVVQAEPVVHPLMTTSFADYTVSEGLLLMILLVIIVNAIARFWRG